MHGEPLAPYGLPPASTGAWSWIPFGWPTPAAALVDIGLLLLAVLATTVFFSARSRLAGWLLVPSLAWTALATAWDAEIGRLAP